MATGQGQVMDVEVGYLTEVIIILLAAVVSVSIFQRLKLTSVLGYLAAGAVIGPYALGLIKDAETARPLAELGVVFLLFTVGLELPIGRVKLLRGSGYGLGAMQVIVTIAAIALACLLAGIELATAIVIGGALALSSTAVVLQLLTERGELTSRLGRSAFAILIIQDLAVGPLLVISLALVGTEAAIGPALGMATLKAIFALGSIVFFGRLALRRLFKSVAVGRNPEIFAATTLLVVFCIGLATKTAGLSMAFGAFLAGMLLAETSYRHQVAAVIQPFRGLLLGLFFITVGMSIDIHVALASPMLIVVLLTALLTSKAALIALIAVAAGQPVRSAIYLGLLLCQGGEFAFVLLGVGAGHGAVPAAMADHLVLVVILSMMITPLLAALARRLLRRMEAADPSFEMVSHGDTENLENHVIIAGYGRSGQAIAEVLARESASFIAIDLDPDIIANARKAGAPVYYGDASRPEVMAALAANRAKAVVVTVDNAVLSVRIVAFIRYFFPDVKVYVRARDEAHHRELRAAGADDIALEPQDAARKMAATIIAADLKPKSSDSEIPFVARG